MNVLFIAPLPPPIHGQSYASKILLEEFRKKYDVRIINISKESSNSNLSRVKRYFEVINILLKVWKYRKKNHAIYITISESLAGNIKDLFTYFIFVGNLSKIIIHLHGGSIKKELWDKRPLLYRINKMFIRKFGGVIISGLTHQEIFIDKIDINKIHVIPNFSPDRMFIAEKELNQKFLKFNPLKILYISGLRDKKGYLDLCESFFLLPEEIKHQVKIDFVGAFESKGEKEKFLNKIAGNEQIQYHGIVDEANKEELSFKSHVFCLPTKYFEGQPISILEAYASGCVVLTTGLGGIKDIFVDNINGFQIQPGNSKSISSKIEYCITAPEKLKIIASRNRKIAFEKYRRRTYASSIIRTLETIIS